MLRTFVLLSLAVSLAAVAGAPTAGGGQEECHVNSYGAAGDGVAYDTAAIQGAIDACNTRGGGVVQFEDGKTYLTASVTVKSNVVLHLPNNTVILAGTKREDYGATQADWYLVLLDNCTACGVTGSGTINGQARSWIDGRGPGRLAVRNFRDASCARAEECRPRLLGVRDARGVVVRGVRLVHPVYWCLHLLRSWDVVVQGVSVQGDWDLYNNDGVDVDGSSNVTVSGCNVDTADDAICIKTTDARHPTSNVQVRDCRLRSRSSAVKIGSESRADMSGLHFSNLQIEGSHRGLAVQLRDEGNVSDVTFEHITLETQLSNSLWWGASEAIYVTAVNRDAATKVGAVQRVVFRNISCVSEGGIVLVGSPGSRLAQVQLHNVSLRLAARSSQPGGELDLRPSEAGVQLLGQLPAVYVDWARDVLLSGVKVQWGSPSRPDWGGLLYAAPRHVDRLTVESLVAEDADTTEEAEQWVVQQLPGSFWADLRRVLHVGGVLGLLLVPTGLLMLVAGEVLRCVRGRGGPGELRHKRQTSTLPLDALDGGAGGVVTGSSMGLGGLAGSSISAAHAALSTPMTPRSRSRKAAPAAATAAGGHPRAKQRLEPAKYGELGGISHAAHDGWTDSRGGSDEDDDLAGGMVALELHAFAAPGGDEGLLLDRDSDR